MEFKENLRKTRKTAKFTQEKLAEELEVSRQTVSKWESGKAYPSTEHIFMISKVLGYNFSSLVGDLASEENIVVKEQKSTFCKKPLFLLLVGAVSALFLLLLGCGASTITSLESRTPTQLDTAKLEFFDHFSDSFLASVLTDFSDKKLVGYGIAAENGAFYVKYDLHGEEGDPCAAIVYFCDEDGDYSYKCQYLDGPDYLPTGEYYRVV